MSRYYNKYIKVCKKYVETKKNIINYYHIDKEATIVFYCSHDNKLLYCSLYGLKSQENGKHTGTHVCIGTPQANSEKRESLKQ